MTRAEILSEIKRAEEESKALVSLAVEAQDQKISEAQAQSRDIIKSAEEEAQKYAESETNAARKKIKEERENLIEKGIKEANEVKNEAKTNIAKATKFMLTEFEREVDA